MDARSEPSHRAESGAGEAADHADPRPTRHGQDAHHPLVALRHLARGSRRQERPRARTAAVPGRSQQEKAADARGDERDDTPRDAVAERRRESDHARHFMPPFNALVHSSRPTQATAFANIAKHWLDKYKKLDTNHKHKSDA